MRGFVWCTSAALFAMAACSGGVSGAGSGSSSKASAGKAGPPITATPPVTTGSTSVAGLPSPPVPSIASSAGGDTPASGGFESAEALTKALVAAENAHDSAAARALFPSDAVIDEFATCKGVRNMKGSLQKKREAGFESGKDDKVEWLSLDKTPSPKKRKKGTEKDGCTFKEEIALYQLKVRVSATHGSKTKKKALKVEAIVFDGRWYLSKA